MTITVLSSDRVLRRHVGGNTTYTRELVRGLPKHGVRYDSVVPRTRPPRRAAAAYYALLDGVHLPLRARALGAQVIHYPADTGPFVPLSSVPIVATIHGLAVRHVRGIRPPVREKVWLERVTLAARAASKIITVSHASARDIQDEFGVSPDSCVVIHNGIDHTRFHPAISTSERSRVRAKHRLPERYLLYLGNIEPRKNLIAAISARDSLRGEKVPPLVIAGRPAWSSDASMAAIRESAACHYIGPLDDEDVAPVMAEAEIFVFPSLYEGFGLPVLESMACGTPVICSARGSLPEVTGDAALRLESPAPGAIADAILSLIRNPDMTETLRVRGLERAQRFTWDKSVASHAEVFRSVASARP